MRYSLGRTGWKRQRTEARGQRPEARERKHKAAPKARTLASGTRPPAAYLISTFAPTSSNVFLIAAASSFGMPSLIGLGARDLADDLDHVDLVGADFRQHRRKLGFLFDRCRRACGRAAGRHGHRHRRGRRDAELLLELLHELRQLEHGDSLDVVDDFLLRQCHVKSAPQKNDESCQPSAVSRAPSLIAESRRLKLRASLTIRISFSLLVPTHSSSHAAQRSAR